MGEFTKFYKSLFAVLVAFLLVCSPILFFNTVVDPYGIFFNAFKQIPMEPNKRYMKMMFLKHNPDKFDSFIFGSSRANSINPSYIPNENYFNMTYSGGMPSQHYEDIQELLRNGVKIKNLLIGIDYSSLLENPDIAKNDLLRKKYPVSFIENILFYKAYLINLPDWEFVKLAFNKSQIDRSTLLVDGIIKNKSHDSIIDAQPLNHLSNVNLSIPHSFYTPNPGIVNNLEQIEKIVRIAKTKHINLIVYVNPTQSTTYLNFNLDDYLEALKSLSKITGYYDFSGLNSVALNNLNFYESSHFREHVGNLIIAKIFNTNNLNIPNDFGNYVTIQNVNYNIRLHKQWFDEFYQATSLALSPKLPFDLKKLVELPISPIYTLQLVNELNANSIKQPMLVTAPWIKLKGNVSTSPNFGDKFAVYIQIGNNLFKTSTGKSGVHEKLNAKGTMMDWQIMIPTSLVKGGLQDIKLVVISEDLTKFSTTELIFTIDLLRRNNPVKITDLKTDTTLVKFSIDMINGIEANQFFELSDEKSLTIKGWAIDKSMQKPNGGVIVSIDGKAYLSQFIFERIDLSNHFNNPDLKYAGWGISIPTSDLKLGEHELGFRFLNSSRTAYYSEMPKIKFKKIQLQMFDFFKGIDKSLVKTKCSIDVINENEIRENEEPILISKNIVKISGWAIDQPAQKLASEIIVEINGKDFKATSGIERPDVAEFYDNTAYKNSGWRIEIPTSLIGKGKHKLKLKILASDKLSYYDAEKEIAIQIK